jgi:hypothetical protein
LVEKLKTWIPAILAGVLLLAEMALNLFGANLHFALWLAVLAFIIQIVILQRELIVLKSPKPNIIIDSFELERPFHLIRDGQPNEVLERFYIMFRNSKLSGKSIADTKAVHAIVSFYNSDCDIQSNLSHEEPFWRDLSGPPWERPDNFSVIISASSKRVGLCLINRRQGASDLYVFCDKSYIKNYRTLEPFQDSLRIPFRKFFVSVQLKSENLDMKPIWISITNRGEREQPSFEIVNSPCNGED